MQKTYPLITTRVWPCLLAVSLLVLPAACGGGTTTIVATHTPKPAFTSIPGGIGNSVTIVNFAFIPVTPIVRMGPKETWTNKDTVTYTITADQGTFNSEFLSPGNSFCFTFTKVGTYS